MSASVPPSRPGGSSLPPLPEHPLVFDSVLDLIGDTPLIEIAPLRPKGGSDGGPDPASPEPRARIFAKLEAANPGGSVKDRICLEMVLDAERRGLLAPGGVVVEPTSGNTGIGLALVCRKRGYRCILTMPRSMSLERRQLLEAIGAEVILTSEEAQMEGAMAKAREVAAVTPGAFIPQQFDNDSNPRVHQETTAQEILHAMAAIEGAQIDAFVAGVGTGGTVTGVGRALRAAGLKTKIIGVEPDSCATLSRGERGPTKIQGLAAGFVPGNYDASVVDEVRTVTDLRAYETKNALAREQGLLVGISAGAAVAIALDVAAELGPNHHIVTVLPDTGERYFSLDDHFAKS